MRTRTAFTFLSTAEPLSLPKALIDFIFKQDRPSDLLSAWVCYYKIAKWGPIQERATMKYIAKQLGWSCAKTRSVKERMKTLELIQDVVHVSDTGVVQGRSVKVLFPGTYKFKSSSRGDLGGTEILHNSRDRKKKTTKKKERSSAHIRLFPKPFSTSKDFAEAWSEWLQYRREKSKVVYKTTAQRQIKLLTKYPVDVAIQMLYQSIERSWTGLFEIPTDKRENPDKLSCDDSKKVFGVLQSLVFGKLDKEERGMLIGTSESILLEWKTLPGSPSSPNVDKATDSRGRVNTSARKSVKYYHTSPERFAEVYAKWLTDSSRKLNNLTPGSLHPERKLWKMFIKDEERRLGLNFSTGRTI